MSTFFDDDHLTAKVEVPDGDALRVLVSIAKVLQNVINDVTVSDSSPLYPSNVLVEKYHGRFRSFLEEIPELMDHKARCVSANLR